MQWFAPTIQCLNPLGYKIKAGPRGKLELRAPIGSLLLPLSLNYVCILLPLSTPQVHTAANSRLHMAALLYFAHSPKHYLVFLCWNTTCPMFVVSFSLW